MLRNSPAQHPHPVAGSKNLCSATLHGLGKYFVVEITVDVLFPVLIVLFVLFAIILQAVGG